MNPPPSRWLSSCRGLPSVNSRLGAETAEKERGGLKLALLLSAMIHRNRGGGGGGVEKNVELNAGKKRTARIVYSELSPPYCSILDSFISLERAHEAR